jgi:hypothetical protein
MALLDILDVVTGLASLPTFGRDEVERRAALRAQEDVAAYALGESQRADAVAAELAQARRRIELLELVVAELEGVCRKAGVDEAAVRASVADAVRELERAWAARQAADAG